ncbi:hypothetical protein BGW38_007736, partial [Lunasporangiospora selenospora]
MKVAKTRKAAAEPTKASKRTLARRMVREHRFSTLTVGALSTNVRRIGLPSNMQIEVTSIIQNCVHDANS